jgi:hypothetical protein
MADGKIVSPGMIAQMIVMRGALVVDMKVKRQSAAFGAHQLERK